MTPASLPVDADSLSYRRPGSVNAPSTSPTPVELQDMLTLAASIPLPTSSTPSSSRPQFTLGGPPSRRPSSFTSTHGRRRSSNLTNDSETRSARLSSEAVTSNNDHNDGKSLYALSSQRNSDSSTSTTSHHTTSSATSYSCKRSDSGCFSDSAISEPTSSGSGFQLSRATSCAHAECVMAQPCERMIELSGILAWPQHSVTHFVPSTPPTGTTISKPPVKLHRDLMILDNACGSSALVTNHLIDVLPVELMQEAQLVATDVSSKVIAEATRRIAEMDWPDHVFTLKMDQEHMLGLSDNSFTHVFTNFGIHLAKDVNSTLKEMKRILAPGGICAFTVWSHLPWLNILRQAIREEYKPKPMPFPLHDDAILCLTRWNPWHDEEWIRKKITEAGFLDTTQVKDDAGLAEEVDKNLGSTKHNNEDWSQYKYDSSESHPSSPQASKTFPPFFPSLSSYTETSDNASTITSPVKMDTSASTKLVTPEVQTGSIAIEEVASVHRYTKHEFMSNFGTSVLDHILTATWGRQSNSKEETRKELREALMRYLVKFCPDQLDEIELEMKALVVIVRKSDKRDVPNQL